MEDGDSDQMSGDESNVPVAPVAHVDNSVADLAALELCSKQEFNTCPLCWMPLFIDHTQKEDLIWGMVQMVFKSKPAFSIRASKYKHERPYMVFGVSPLIPKTTSMQSSDYITNCQGCHFIHRCSDVMSNFTAVWQSVQPRNNLKPVFQRSQNHIIYGIYQRLNKTDGMLFGGVDDIFPKIPGSGDGMKNFQDNNVFSTVSSGTFSGCIDCNSKMTINKYFNVLFEMLVSDDKKQSIEVAAKAQAKRLQAGRGRPSGGGGGRSGNRVRALTDAALENIAKQAVLKDIDNNFSTEVKTYYIILSGLLDSGQIITTDPSNYLFTQPVADIPMWSYRYVVIWCLLQIIFACWEESTIEPRFKHHVTYVYEGIQNFYLSLLFFAMHSTRGVMLPLNSPIRFNVFHFFYSSHLPFFLISRGIKNANQRSLSACALDKQVLTFSNGVNITIMRAQFTSLKASVMKFWNECFEPLSDFLLGINTEPVYEMFFCDLNAATRMSDQAIRRELTVQSFKDFFTASPDYWFHFKSITMPRIEQDCERYYQTQPTQLGKQVWAQWYNYFCQCVLRLGMRQGQIINSRFRLLGDGPRIHLATYLRAYGPHRWRTRVE